MTQSTHDGIIDGIVERAQQAVGTSDAFPSDTVISVMASFHREEYAQQEEIIKQLKDLIKTLKNNNGNGDSRKWRDKARQAGPTIFGAGGAGALIVAFLKDSLI